MSHRPRRSPHPPPPPPIPAAHARSPSASSASSTSSHHSHHSNPRTVNSGFTVFPNSSTSTIKLVAPSGSFESPKTPTQQTHSGNVNSSPISAGGSAGAPGARAGFFDPALMHPQSPEYAARKRSATGSSTASPPGTASTLASTLSYGGEAVGGQQQSSPIPIPPVPSMMHQQPPASTPPAKKEGSSKMKIFSKPSRIGTPGFGSSMAGIEKTLRPPLSPSKLPSLPGRTSTDSRKTSFSTDHTPVYSESPPSTSSKSHSFLSRSSRKDKDKAAAQAAAAALPPPPPLPAELSSSLSTHKTSFDLPYPNFLPGSPANPDGKHPGSGNPLTTTTTTTSIGSTSSINNVSSIPGVTGEPTEDPWPYLRAQILPLFQSASLDAPIEHLNAACRMWIRRYIERRNPVALLSDFRELLEQGMRSLDPSLASTATEDDLVPRLVEMWAEVFSFTTPYLEAVFLPLQMEFKGVGPLMSPREARDFWGVETAPMENTPMGLDVRRLIMVAFRDAVVLPLREKLRIVFSRLRMDFSVSQRQATEVVARMLQCVSVLGGCQTGDMWQEEMDGLGSILKHNWLGKGRTGRNRKGFVGVRMARGGDGG